MNEKSIVDLNHAMATEDFALMMNPVFISRMGLICRAMALAVENDMGITLNREELVLVGRAVFVATSLAHKALLSEKESHV